MKNKISFGVIVLFAFILGGLSMYYFSSKNKVVVTESGEQVSVSNTCKSCNSTVIMENGSLAASVEKTFNSVVMVKTFNNSKLKGTGSGFIYKIEGDYAYIITNHHVIDGGNKWTVITSTDEEVEGTVLGSDEYVDIAVIKVKKKSYMEVVTTVSADNKVNLGDTVFTIGAPVGYEYRGTVTNGIVSGLNRLVEVAVNSTTEDYVMEVIQTNTAVNPGNSGGPLFNTNGEVVGVISMKLVENSIEGMGFAIPIDYAMSHVNKLEKGEKIDRPLLGISMANISDQYLLFQNRIIIPEGVDEGVVVVEVSSNSGAAKSDLIKGDVITKLNGSAVKNAAYLKYLLYKYNPGDTVVITYNRNGKEATTKITLTKNEG